MVSVDETTGAHMQSLLITLSKCLRVCQQWKQILTSWPRFWIHMDLSAARREVKSTTLLKYIAYANDGVRTAVLNKVVLQASPILSKLVSKSQNLYSLSLLSGGSLQNSLDKALGQAWGLRVLTLSDKVVVTIETLARCLEGCSTLEEVTCDNLEMRPRPGGIPPAWQSLDYAKLVSWSISVWPKSSNQASLVNIHFQTRTKTYNFSH